VKSRLQTPTISDPRTFRICETCVPAILPDPTIATFNMDSAERASGCVSVKSWPRRAAPARRTKCFAPASMTHADSEAAWLSVRDVSRRSLWSRREELNTPSADYNSAALPLSYTG